MLVPTFAVVMSSAMDPDLAAIAVTAPEGNFVSWRESVKLAGPVDIYRTQGGKKTRVGRVAKDGTCFLDRSGAPDASYELRHGGRAHPVWGQGRAYLSIPLVPRPGYTANDGSVGDLDGDGRLEIVIHRTGRSKDNSQSGPTDPPVLEAYRLDGRRLWEIDLGRNIREGAHYTQFLVYDFDGDGRAEVACKTADGTRDGRGRTIGDPTADHRNEAGYVLRGPEFLTVFDGRTGAARSTVRYLPGRHPETDTPTPDQMKAVWGDGYGNRLDRFLAGVAYLDGRHPSLIFSRGYYTRTVIAAWDFKGGELQSRWVFDSDEEGNAKYAGQGNHGFAVADVDGDARDEIVFGSMTLDDDGRGLYSTGLGHGDALHVGDLDPARPGMEVFAIHEHQRQGIGFTFRDARTGAILWQRPSPDTGRGVAIDVDPRFPGAECWSSMSNQPSGIVSAAGEAVSSKQPKTCNFAVWWDGDPLREILDSNRITKWNWEKERDELLMEATGCVSNNGTKSTPVLSADILGDWREEVIWRSADDSELRVYSTPIPTRIRMPSLMTDRQYRLAIAGQNIGYNQPPHPSFDMVSRVRSSRPTLWLVGDSTVRNGGGRGDNGQWGWGDLLAPHFDPDRINVVNRAIGGRSSRTFLTEGRWDAILKEAKAGDTVLIQFGHNDPGAINDDSRARGSIPGIGEETQEIDNRLTKKHEVVHTFGWYMRRYIHDARANGLHPVVFTYVPRCPRPGERFTAGGAPTSYRKWAMEVGETEGVPVIDLYGLIGEEYAKRTAEEIKASYFCDADFTHTNRLGAAHNARAVVRGIAALPESHLKDCLRSHLR
jgi:rhamnogalacturonan endolyase